MLKKSFIIPFICFLSVFAHAQNDNISITIGSPYQVIDAASKRYYYDNDEIMIIRMIKDDIIIQKFDANLKFVQQHVYTDIPVDAYIEKIDKFGGQYYLFYSLWDQVNFREQLFYRKLDFANGILEKKIVNLITVEGKVTGQLSLSGFYGMSSTVQDKFDFQYSKDDTKLLIKYRVKPSVRNDDISYDVIGLNVFDRSLNKLWNKEVTMPYTEKKMNNVDYSIDSEGNSYILATVYDDETTDIKKSRDGDINYHMELLRIKANSAEIEKTAVSLDGKFINDIALFETSEDYMICAGFYNIGETRSNANGIFTFKIKKEGAAYDMRHHEIPMQILNQNVSKKEKRKNSKEEDAEFKYVSFDRLSMTADGGVLLVGEQYYQTQKPGMNNTYYTIRHWDDILVTRLDKEGNLVWMKKIPKRQIGGEIGVGSASYKFFTNSKDHYFMFLDNEDNDNLSSEDVPKSIVTKGVGPLISYKVNDATGEIERIPILNTRDVKGMEVYQFKPTGMMQSGENEFIIEVYKKNKEDVLIRLKFND